MTYSRTKRDEIISLIKWIKKVASCKEILFIPIDILGISKRTLNSLYQAGIKTLSDLSQISHEKLHKVRNIDKKVVYELKSAMETLLQKNFVRHPVWGTGIVYYCYGDGDEQKLIVDLPKVGFKRLSAMFANLKKLSVNGGFLTVYNRFYGIG